MSMVIFCCETLAAHVRAAQETCRTDYPVVWLDRMLHEDPAHMRDHILEKLAALPQEVDTVLVAMGFCGGAWQDVCCDRRLVIPRVDDCVTIAMTCTDVFNSCTKKAGHMYQFGNNEWDFSIGAIYDQLFQKHDPEVAEMAFEMYFEHYHHLDVIDTGLYDCYEEAFVARVQADADRIEAELAFVPGGNLLLEKLISGQWDHQFFVVLPGTRITQGTFFDGGKEH